MHKRLVLNIIARVLFIVNISMLLPLFWAIYYNPMDREVFVFFIIIMSGFILFYLINKITKISNYQIENMSPKDGMAIVGLSWIAVSLYGALPYFLVGVVPNFIDAFFESVSGFTTTGATVFNNIEVLPKGILFWRSLTHWLGGMGIIVLSVALLPAFGKGAFQLFKAEVPGPTAEKLKPKIIHTAKILWTVYIILSVSETILLLFGGMPFFDALCHTFGTMATGGFSTKNASIAHYSPYIQWVIIVFMIFAGANFILHYRLLMGFSLKHYWKSEEFRVYFAMILFLSFFFVFYSTAFSEKTIALRDSAFQIISILTTTGYVTADFDRWPGLLKMILVILMFVGGCAGSTGGGMKVVRVYTLIKASINNILKSIFPNGVFTVKIDSIAIEERLVYGVLVYFFIFTALFVLGTLSMLITDKSDVITSFSASIACLGNIGPGLAKVGAVKNYSWISPSGKIILSFLMLAGRLELYPVLILFSRSIWRK